MADGRRSSAVIVPVPEADPALEAWRVRAGAASTGLPAHVTLVVPFVPAAEIAEEVVAGLRTVVAGVAAFRFELRETRRFPRTLYLAPDPPEPFVRLTEAIVERYPQYPPYGGAFDSIVPHVTVAEGDEPVLEASAISVGPLLPIAAVAREVALLEELEAGWARWRVRARVPLG